MTAFRLNPLLEKFLRVAKRGEGKARYRSNTIEHESSGTVWPQGRRFKNEELMLSAQVLAAVTIVSGWHIGRSRLCILKLSVIVEAQSLPIGF